MNLLLNMSAIDIINEMEKCKKDMDVAGYMFLQKWLNWFLSNPSNHNIGTGKSDRCSYLANQNAQRSRS